MVKREGRVAIPWWVYVLVSITVGFYAKLMEHKDPQNVAMTMFFYLAIVFLLVGLGKFALKKFQQNDRTTTAKKTEFNTGNQQFEQPINRGAQLRERERRIAKEVDAKNTTPAEHNIIACPRCGTKHYSSSNFCHKCGARLK